MIRINQIWKNSITLTRIYLMLADLLTKQVIMLILPRERERERERERKRERDGKIPNIIGLATTAALTAV